MNRNKKNYLFTLLVLFFVNSITYAQQLSISGQVWDGKLNEPMFGVNVVVKGTTTGTTTDFDGKFAIKCTVGQTLEFTSLGYKPVQIEVKSNSDFSNVVMVEDAELLGEVVIVGYGTQTKASSVGAITTTKGDDLLQVGSVRSVSEALQGQMPGVVSISTTSKPGADAASIFIRGKATWGDASPMVLIDGIERDFNDVDVNEIESISVLKDASATAVYGVKGANGVILLTTKRGKNEAPTVKFSYTLGFKAPTTDYEFSDYVTAMKMYNEAVANDGDWTKLIPESTIAAWENAYATGNYGPYNDLFPEIDWQNEIIKDVALSHTYNVNISGGTERMKYFASLGYLNDGDIYKADANNEFDPSFYYKRYNWRTNFDFALSKTTDFAVNIAGKMGYRNEPGYRQDSSDHYLFSQFISTPTNMFPIQYDDGTWGAQQDGGGNLVAVLNQLGQRQYQSFQGFYDFNLKQKLDFITKGLSAKAALSYTASSSEYFQILKGGVYGLATSESEKQAYLRVYRQYDYSNPIVGADGSISYPLIDEHWSPNEQTEDDLPIGASYDNYSAASRKLYYEFSLNYKRSFNNHNVTALALFNRKTEQSNVAFPSYEEDWVGRVTYNWKERYLTEINAAYTGSEKFAPGLRYGFFPSFSVGWRVTEEPFMATLRDSWLDNLKIRYSWGKVGSDKGSARFNYVQLYSSGSNVSFGNSSGVSYGPLYFEGALADPNATWETAIKQNLGFEMKFIKKLTANVDLYNEHRTGILMARNTVAPWIGAALPSMNLGETKSHGIDVDLGWNDKIGNLNYFAKFNFSTSENRQVFRDDPADLYDYQKNAGKPIGYQGRYLASGNFGSIDDIFNSAHTALSNTQQSTLVSGDLAYMDYNGDGKIDANDKVPMEELNYPLTTYGLTLGGNWKGIGFNILLYAAPDIYKNQINSYLFDFPGSNIKAQPSTLDRWTTADASTNGLIRPSVHLNNTYNQLENTYIYSNHGYLRLKNAEINYVLPKRITQKVQISNCQFFVNGTNLFTISMVDPRRDPETGDGNTYPIVKRYNVGVRLTFN